jgi:hypothetical protein
MGLDRRTSSTIPVARAARVLGPYRQRNGRWRVILVGVDGTRASRSFTDEHHARQTTEALQRAIAPKARGSA